MIKTAIVSAIALFAAQAACLAAPFSLNLDGAKPGAVPPGWTMAKTGSGPGSVWKVATDTDGKPVLAQTSDQGPNKLFNLCIADGTQFTDLDLTVRFKAVAGKLDQGGGPVWRYRDADNYYIARMNPLEDNFRVYKVVAGKRTQLATADVKAAAGQWHTIRVVARGPRIECFFNGRPYLDVRDDTFTAAGKIGLWTKADAQTYFSDLRASEAVEAKTTSSAATVRVAAIQFISRWARPADNRQALTPLIREAAQHGAKIVVLPEAAIPAYMSHDIRLTWQVAGRRPTTGLQGISPQTVAETVPGESTREFGALAKELGIYLTVPLVEVAKENKHYNTLVLMGPDGEIALHYRKVNPWPWAERSWATAGDRGQQFLDTAYGRLGLLICFDINFEPAKLKEKHVDHLLYAIAWVDDPQSTWFSKSLPEIARTSNLNIIGANWSVPDQPGWHGYGQSEIIARTGQILARAKSDLGNEILYADLPVAK